MGPTNEISGGGKPNYHVVISGGTGEVGSEIIRDLLKNHDDVIEKLTIYVRKKKEVKYWFNTENKKIATDKINQVIVNYDKLPDISKESYTHAFCCLGTYRSRAGAAGFKKVDLDYVVNFAKTCTKLQNLSCFCLCSSAGANAKSSLLYTRIKGEAEDALKDLNFKTLVIARPGFLFGKEDHDQAVKKVVVALTPNKFGVHKVVVGKAMVAESLKTTSKKLTILTNDDIRKYGPEMETNNC